MPWWDIALGAGFVILALLVWLLKPQSRAVVPVQGQGTMDDVQRLVSEGQKIAAIKIYRRIHGASLREAKEAIEAMEP
jgi:ribosomal protein L7/L12